MKVYVVVESSWTGTCYLASRSGVYVYSNREEAEKHLEEVQESYGADVEAFLVEEEIIDKYE